ncbi:hypothetical protein OC835_001301 [Tilletia horrida]|nr:hypothetical protein OC835_001301 [Tilletia horrida]
MVSAFKSRRRGGVTATRFLFVGIILAVFGSLLLAAASPLDPDFVDDEAVDLFARATGNHTGKYVGSSCRSSDECYSKNCEDGICQRQPLGGPCFKGANCATRYCDLSDGSCRDPSHLLGVCGGDNESCSTRANGGQLVCDGNFCKLKDGAACTRDKVCLSGSCGPDKTCINTGLPPFARCEENSDCKSGQCISCFNLRDFSDCSGDDYFAYFCDRFELGHSCSDTNQCKTGVCRHGTCSPSQIGDPCKGQYTCTNGQVCSPDNRCYIPSSSSLKSAQVCTMDDQCFSKRCTHYILPRDEDGINRASTPSYNPDLLCDYLQTGESPCYSTNDCATDVCKNGTCEPAQVGEQCDVNYRCAGSSVCNWDGICYDPPKNSVSAGSPCRSDDNCLSGSCNDIGYPEITRYTLGNPRSPFQAEDTTCLPSQLGEACAATSDCVSGLTCDDSTKTCSGLALGASCTNNKVCASKTCLGGKCAISAAYNFCRADSDCFSGSCGNPDCYYGGCDGTACDPIPDGGACRTNADCIFPTSLCDAGVCVHN